MKKKSVTPGSSSLIEISILNADDLNDYVRLPSAKSTNDFNENNLNVH